MVDKLFSFFGATFLSFCEFLHTHIHKYLFFIIIIMSTESKLRSFTVENLNKYNKFVEIQRNRGKKTGQRLNELMEKEIKETDPNFKDSSAVRAKDAPDLVVPNPFVMDQAHALPIWTNYLKTLTKKEHSDIYLLTLAIELLTKSFDDCVDSQRRG